MTVRQHVRNVLLVIFGGAFCATALVGWMVYYYSPSGTYHLNKVLLEPGILRTLSYTDINPATGKQSRYKYDRVDFSYINHESGRWQRKTVEMENYARLYDLMRGDSSMADTAEIATEFDRSRVAVLALRVHLQGDPSQGGKREFQEVQFIDEGDYYRVEIHDDSPSITWAYFHHPGIYKDVIKLISE